VVRNPPEVGRIFLLSEDRKEERGKEGKRERVSVGGS
jgi:hypothetical protein